MWKTPDDFARCTKFNAPNHTHSGCEKLPNRKIIIIMKKKTTEIKTLQYQMCDHLWCKRIYGSRCSLNCDDQWANQRAQQMPFPLWEMNELKAPETNRKSIQNTHKRKQKLTEKKRKGNEWLKQNNQTGSTRNFGIYFASLIQKMLCIDFNLFKRNNARELLLLDLCKMLAWDFSVLHGFLSHRIASLRIWYTDSFTFSFFLSLSLALARSLGFQKFDESSIKSRTEFIQRTYDVLWWLYFQ